MPAQHTMDDSDVSATVPFWETLETGADALAVWNTIDDERLSYAALGSEVRRHAEQLRVHLGTRALVLLVCGNDAPTVLGYLSSLAAGHAVYPIPRKLPPSLLATAVETYRPELVLQADVSELPLELQGYQYHGTIARCHALLRRSCSDGSPHPELALLLSTSASTGTAKVVRLSRKNLVAGAVQVAKALRVTGTDRASLHLPLHHVYGLSVLNSHLHAGGSVVLLNHPTVTPKFWNTLAHTEVTHFAGVSFIYDTMMAQNIGPQQLPRVRKLTHSGDAIAAHRVSWLRQHFVTRGADLYLMYGQTEASGRMCVLPPELLDQKPGSVGRPVSFCTAGVSPEGEIIFRGPNVMLGYAETREDLCRGDDLQGVLRTSDRGHFDQDGFVYISGRSARICKICDARVSLDDVESYFYPVAPVAAIERGGNIVVFYVEGENAIRHHAQRLATDYHLPRQLIRLHRIAEIPRGAAGKITYSALDALL